MCTNLNPMEIKKIIVDSKEESNFPKNKVGKNDRLAMINGMEHGHKYYVTVTFIYNDWSEYKTTLTIEKLIQNREFVQVRDTGEGRFTTFVILFNSLLAGTFKREAQLQSDAYFEKVEKMNAKIEKAQEETDEQKQIVLQQGIKISVLESENKILESKNEDLQYQLVVRDNRITKLEKENEDLNTKAENNKENISYDEKAIDQFVRMTEMLVQSKVDHTTIVEAMKNNFKDLFIK